MDWLADLRATLPEDRVVSEGEDFERHGGGVFTYHEARVPDAVVYPENREEVAEVLRFANERHVPIVPFRGGE